MRVSENQWLTHNNGGRPFLVKLDESTLSVYKLHLDENEPEGGIEIEDGTYHFCVQYDVDWCLPAKEEPILGGGSVVWGPLNEECEGHCVLAKISGQNEAVFIGRAVVTFQIYEDEHLESDARVPDAPSFYSTSCSNDVWYPVARTNYATYVLSDHMSPGPILKLPHGRLAPEDYDDSYPAKAFDPFTVLFGDRGDVDFDNIGHEVAVVMFY
jgi:hypothetical protein